MGREVRAGGEDDGHGALIELADQDVKVMLTVQYKGTRQRDSKEGVYQEGLLFC